MFIHYLIDEIPRILIPILFFYIHIRIVYLKKHNKDIKTINELINLLFVVYVCSVAAILVIPRFEIYIMSWNPLQLGYQLAYELADTNERAINLIPFASISQQISDLENGIRENHPLTNLIANFCLMLPMPVFIKIINNKIKGIYCLLITLGIIVFCEATQYFRAARECDIDDIILNFLGAVMGMAAFNIAKSIYFKVKQNKE